MLCKSMLNVVSVGFLIVMATAGFAPPLADQVQEVASTPVPAGVRENPAATPAPNRTLHLTFALSSVRRAGLEAHNKTLHDPQSPNYHRWLTPQEVGQQFGAQDADIQAVVDYAKSQGFEVTQVWPNRLF